MQKKTKMTKTHRLRFCDNRSELWMTLHKCHYGQKEWYALVRQIGSCLLFWQMHSWCVRLCKCKGRNLSQASIVRPQWPLNCALCECDNDRPTCWLNCLNSTQHSLHFFIGPTSDHCLALSVINWLTSVLWASLILLKILTKYKLSLYTLDLVIFLFPHVVITFYHQDDFILHWNWQNVGVFLLYFLLFVFIMIYMDKKWLFLMTLFQKRV